MAGPKTNLPRLPKKLLARLTSRQKRGNAAQKNEWKEEDMPPFWTLDLTYMQGVLKPALAKKRKESNIGKLPAALAFQLLWPGSASAPTGKGRPPIAAHLLRLYLWTKYVPVMGNDEACRLTGCREKDGEEFVLPGSRYRKYIRLRSYLEESRDFLLKAFPSRSVWAAAKSALENPAELGTDSDIIEDIEEAVGMTPEEVLEFMDQVDELAAKVEKSVKRMKKGVPTQITRFTGKLKMGGDARGWFTEELGHAVRYEKAYQEAMRYPPPEPCDCGKVRGNHGHCVVCGAALPIVPGFLAGAVQPPNHPEVFRFACGKHWFEILQAAEREGDSSYGGKTGGKEIKEVKKGKKEKQGGERWRSAQKTSVKRSKAR